MALKVILILASFHFKVKRKVINNAYTLLQLEKATNRTTALWFQVRFRKISSVVISTEKEWSTDDRSSFRIAEIDELVINGGQPLEWN